MKKLTALYLDIHAVYIDIHISIAILKPIVAQSYERVRIFTSDREHLLTDGEIRNLRLEKIGDFNPRFCKYNYFNGF